MVKTALNSKRKLIYSIKWYAFIIVQVVKFMHKRVTCKWFWAIYLSFHFVFWQIFKCNIRQRLIYCNHFSVAKFFFGTIFRLNYFVYFIWPKDKAFWWKGVVSMTVFFLSLSLFLCIRYNLWGTIQILWQLFYYLNFVYLLLLLFNFHDMKMNTVSMANILLCPSSEVD